MQLWPPAAGLEGGAADRIRATLQQLASDAQIREAQVAVIGLSYQARIPMLPELLNSFLAAEWRERIFLDPGPQDASGRSDWVIDLMERYPQMLPTAVYFGTESEFNNFAYVMGPTPLGIRHFRTNIQNPAYLVMEFFQAMGLPVNHLGAQQRRNLLNDLALLIRA